MAREKNNTSGSLVNKSKRLNFYSIKAAQKQINIRDRMLINVLSEAGCTLSELVNIKVRDIGRDSITFGNRRVEISPGLWREAKELLKGKEKSEFLFSSRQSNQLNARRAQQIVKESLGTSPSKVRQQRIREMAKDKGHEAANRSFGISWLKQKSFLSQDEIKRVRGQIHNTKHLLMFDLLLETGCHISELVQLRINDIEGNAIRLEGRVARVSGSLALRLNKPIGGQGIGFIFSSRQSNHVSDKRVFQILQSYGKAAQVALNQRILRNTKIASMLSSGKARALIESEMGIKRLEFGSYGLLNEN